jgi:hypothetical protein
MSLITAVENVAKKIIADEKSTAAWLEKEVTVIEGKAPTIEKVIDTTLTYVGPALTIALDALGETQLAADIAPLIVKAKTDLAVASALVTDLGPTPTAASAFADVVTNLSGVLTAVKVSNPTTIAAVTKAVTEVGVLGAAVATAAAAIKASAAPAPAPAPVAAAA